MKRILVHNHESNNGEKLVKREEFIRKMYLAIFSCFIMLFLSSFLLAFLIFQSNSYFIGQNVVNRHKFTPPRAMVGHCNGTCVPNEAYPCIFASFYPVTFTKDGQWRWDCPFLDGSGIEVGMARMLTPPQEEIHWNGSWRARWYGGNQIQSDPNKRVHCGCYYVGGEGDGKPWIFKSFETKFVKIAKDKSIEDICGAFNGCPKTEEEAYSAIGSSPWIEKFFDCK